MSVLTRLLIPLIPVSAALYFVALHSSWAFRSIFRDQFRLEQSARKQDVEIRDVKIKEYAAKIDAILEEIEQRKNQIIDRNHEIEVKTQQKTEILADIDRIKHDTAQIKADIDNLRENVFKRQETLVKMMIAECDVLRQELDEVIADKAHAESRLAQIQDQVVKIQADKRQAKELTVEAEKEARRKGWIIAGLEKRGIPVARWIIDLPMRMDIQARIVASDPQQGVYTIDKGEEFGIKPGMEFVVFRKDNYVGDIVIKRVFPKEAAGIEFPMEKTMKMDIQVGDMATTILGNPKSR